MSGDGSLPAKHRLARNVHEGYEVQLDDGQWVRVASVLHITAPIAVSAFTLATGEEASAHPSARIMSRRIPDASP